MENHLLGIKERLKAPCLVEKSIRKEFLRILDKIKIAPSSKALSISTAEGRWDYIVFENKKEISEIIATDIVTCPVAKIDIKSLNLMGKWSFVKLEAEKELPFEDESFDLIYHHDVLEHVQKANLFLQEQYRVLEKGGYLILVTPNLLRPGNIFKMLTGKLDFPVTLTYQEEIGGCVHIQEFTKWQLIAMLEEIGFKEVNLRSCFFGIHFLGIKFSDLPKSRIGAMFSNYFVIYAKK